MLHYPSPHHPIVERSVTETTYHCGDVSEELTIVEMSVTERIYHCGDISVELIIVEMSVNNLPLWRHQ